MTRQKVFMTLALLCAVVQGAWADVTSSFGGGDGSAKNPYIINTAAHWNQFTSDVNGGNTYSDTYFLLGDDISVTTMVGAGTTGNNAKPFSGTFDGGGHTLTFNYDGSGDDIAPFRFIRNALINNLHVAGEIKTSGRHAGGLAGRTYGTTRIVGCRVSTVIRSSVAGDGTHGGIVALKPDWSNAHLTIEGCVYDGKIVTTNGTTLCGGFVGYTSYGSLTIKNSIYAPAEDETTVSSEYTFYRYNDKHPGAITLTNCYYTQTLGKAQGKQARSIGFHEGVDITVVPTGNATEYGASGITGYGGNQCVKYNGTVYAGYEDVVTLTFSHNYVGCTVKNFDIAEGGNATLSGNDTIGYTLTMDDANVIFIFSMTGPSLPGFDGNGSADNPYDIYHEEIWNYIVGAISRNEGNFATAYYKLTADITVTTMMGSENHRFKGHFDGGIYDENHQLVGNHTLTVNYDTDEQFTAPFRYVEGAEISNLCVAGTINTSNKFAAGFVADSKGGNTMTNCRSSVTINSSVNGDGSHGGFVAYNSGGRFKMEGCVFDGSLLGSSTDNCGGFVGWNETNGSPEGIVEFRNCLFAPTSITVGIGHTYARSRTNDGSHVQMYYSNCRTNFDDNQQFRVYSISAGDGVTIEANQTVANTYTVSGITIYDTGLMYDGVLYTRENKPMSLNLDYNKTVPDGCTLSGFSTTAGTLEGDGNPFTFMMGKADAVINALITGGNSGWTHGGNGTSESPYIISTTEQWNEFADKVNNGVFGFNNAYYKLAADITVTTMVGTDGHKFKGHFDGGIYDENHQLVGNHTLTLSYGSDQTPFSEDYCAPFRYIEGAEIKNLTVDGTIYTKNMFAASIAGYALNNNTITNCRSSVTINSSFNGDGTHGGFVANCQNNDDSETNVTFTNCAFDGKLLGTDTNNWGGFVGWTEGNDWAGVKFIDCLFAPSEVSVNSDGCATFSRGRENNRNRITVENGYYTQSLGTMQGEMAYASQPANVTTVPITIAGITVYVKKTLVTNVTATDITPNEATISWTGTDVCSNYQVRYRVKQNLDTYSTSFEDGMPADWTTFGNDDDEYNWTYEDGTKKGMAHSGKGCMYSASYINNYGALEPDNWLVSPSLTLGGTMKVWLKGQDEDENREHFAIYLSLTGGSKSDFVDESGNLQDGVITLVPETETTNIYQEYTADLSAYNGLNETGTGYIAIRHFNCYDEFYLVVDDFSIYDDNVGGEWSTVSGDSPTTIEELEPETEYEYQVGYDYGGNTFYSPTATLTTLKDNIVPMDLSATAITANTATISWTGYGDSYNLRYSQGGGVKVTLYVPNDIWDDESGYQMLLDKDHDTYGSVIPEQGGLTSSGDASVDTYAQFEYKIPTAADGILTTDNVVDGTDGNKSVTITIVAGIYDWCITNPSPDDRVWIASENGNVGGRQDDFVFEAGKHYTFTVTFDGSFGYDCVNMEVEDDASTEPGDVTNITGITNTSYTLSDLTALTDYTIYVQSVKGNKTSEWSSTFFTTTDESSIGLVDDGDNTAVIDANINKQRDVTLAGRTLYKDGDWNTLCLPFDLDDFTGTPLEDAIVMALDNSEDCNTGFDATTGTLTLDFVEANQIEAGHAYIVKWETMDDPIENPVFNGVNIVNESPDDQSIVSKDGYVTFIGTYGPSNIYTAEKTNLYLGANNMLYYPTNKDFVVNACRAYFQLNNGLVCGEPNTPGNINAFVLNFGDDSSGIENLQSSIFNIQSESWYTLDGRKLNGKPKNKGIYINNGHKVVIK